MLNAWKRKIFYSVCIGFLFLSMQMQPAFSQPSSGRDDQFIGAKEKKSSIWNDGLTIAAYSLGAAAASSLFYSQVESVYKNFNRTSAFVLGGGAAVGALFGISHVVNRRMDAWKEAKKRKAYLLSLEEMDFRPKTIKAYLDEYVIGQEEAKISLATTMSDHYEYILRYEKIRVGHDLKSKKEDPTYLKNNILLLGPTGSGKTFLVQTLAQKFSLPFINVDSSKLVPSGFVGTTIQDVLQLLIDRSQGDIGTAQYGVIYFDEVDKLAEATGVTSVNNFKSQIQNELLRLIEGDEVQVGQRSVLSTKNVLFVFGGAFSGIEYIVQHRLHTQGSQHKFVKNGSFYSLVEGTDLISYGLKPELVGRFTSTTPLQDLSEAELLKVVTESKQSPYLAQQGKFARLGVQIEMGDDAMQCIVRYAKSQKLGTRSLASAFEKIFRPIRFDFEEYQKDGVIQIGLDEVAHELNTSCMER